MERVINGATDFDGDGYGWISFPPDFAPFDSQEHPFAVDTPGNGVDENGVGGDLPSAAVAVEQSSKVLRPPTVAITPDVLLIIPCSLRHDAVFGGQLGSSVTPNLANLSREGVAVDPAYSHTGFTTSSVKQAFCGHLAYEREGLVDDFKSWGYRVAVFSVQDEHFGNIHQVCGFDKADYYFDASLAVQDRVTTYSTPSSLIISAERMLREVDKYLSQESDTAPIFLYVHFETTHYPYSHDSPRDIATQKTTGCNTFIPSKRRSLIEVYRNAAAHLDAQIGHLLSIFRTKRHMGDPVVVLIADHGESLFDDGTLGHGLQIDEVQTRVPCIIVNGWMDIPVPFGLVDVRPYLLGMLGTPHVRNRKPALYRASRPVFQYCGGLASPSSIASARLEGRVTVDFLKGVYIDEGGTVVPLAEALAANPQSGNLVHQWEAIRYLRHTEMQSERSSSR